MKFIHAADVHLDSPLRQLVLQDGDGRQIERMRRATREAFERMIDLCIDQRVAFLVLAGDLYDHDCPNMQIAVFLRNQLARLEKEKIRVVIKKGNHDAANKITSALSLPSNTVIFSDKKPETIVYDDLPVPVAFHGQSFKPGPITTNLAADYPVPLPGYLNIGVLHTSLAGSPEHDPYAPCKLDDLTTRGYAYWALGHIHKGAIVARDPWVVYPGNLQGRHAKETGPKGCVLVETENNRIVSAEHIAVDVVRWCQAVVDLQGAAGEPELVEGIRSALTQAHRDADGRPAAIRLVLTGQTSLHPMIESKPNRLRQTVLELAGEIAGDDIWIEKIQNETDLPAAGRNVASNEAASELIGIMREIAGDASRIGPLLEKELEPLRTKLPEELKELPGFKLLDDVGLVRDALARIEPRLAARLAGEEDA